ncbi:unnamed protein product [Alopecurus aequalis]
MASVGVDMAREILLRLPTTDLVRCSCVCKLWRAVVSDPAFRNRHGDAADAVAEAETLLVTEFQGQGMGSEMTVLSATSGTKPIRRFTELAAGYSPANACNGFLLLASAVLDWPVFVCNPVTGEKLKIPAPASSGKEQVKRCTYAMGFIESARLYKLFRMSFPGTATWTRTQDCYLDVYTLGGWRRHPNLFHAKYDLRPPPPVLLGGKLYVVIERLENFRAPDMVLVIDVESEAHDTYWLPEMFTEPVSAAVHPLDLSGKLCVAIRIIGRRRVNFWVLSSLKGRRKLDWERRYTFYLDTDREYGDKPCCAWLDGSDGMLCYRFGDRLYKWHTTAKKRQKQMMELPPTADQRWNVYGGYRPSLLSPYMAFSTPGSLVQEHREKQEQFEYTLRHALRPQQSSKKRCCTTCPPDCQHGAKRIRAPANN